MTALSTDTGIRLLPDSTRVISRFFVPGHEDVGPSTSRAGRVIARILAMDESEIEAALHEVDARFDGRHLDLHDTFRRHAGLIASRIGADAHLSPARQLLLGASFTHEYALEGSALCNPSAVLHPHQPGGDAAFIVSVRGIGEGHISSIGFRTGTVSASGHVTIDPPGQFPRTGDTTPGIHRRSVFHARLAELDDDYENAAYVLDPLAQHFDDAALEASIGRLAADFMTRRNTSMTIANLRHVASLSYRVEFSDVPDMSERVLWPRSPAEFHGMEDARFVRFVDDWGRVIYYATYTAFDGLNTAVHLLETTDFTTFAVSPVAGAAALGKGLAMFPRRIRGHYAALSRADRETNSIAFSDDLHYWAVAHSIQIPERSWEVLQLGNCGSPIETDAGWLVLTHGVGPMRTYSIGAVLLDIEEPQRVVARSDHPIISPPIDQRGGYVPNVVYSCGGFAHGDLLVIPYGVSDQSISVATMSIRELLASLSPVT